MIVLCLSQDEVNQIVTSNVRLKQVNVKLRMKNSNVDK